MGVCVCMCAWGPCQCGSGAGTKRAALERLALSASQVGVVRRPYHPLRQAHIVFGHHAPGSTMHSHGSQSLRGGSASAPLRVCVCQGACVHACMCADLEIRGRHGADDVAQLAASRSVSAVLIRRLVRVTEGLAPAAAPALEAALQGRWRAGLGARRAHALEGPLKRRLPRALPPGLGLVLVFQRGLPWLGRLNISLACSRAAAEDSAVSLAASALILSWLLKHCPGLRKIFSFFSPILNFETTTHTGSNAEPDILGAGFAIEPDDCARRRRWRRPCRLPDARR